MTGVGRLDHIDIVVEDVVRMRDFLIAIGFEFVRQTDHGGGAVELRFPGGADQPILELTPAQAGNGTRRPLGLRHMALSVDDIDATSRQLSQVGLEVETPRVVPETARRIANVTAPDGNLLQLVECGSENKLRRGRTM